MDAVVANSHAAAREAVEQEGVDPERIHVIHNAVESPTPDGRVRTEVRHRWGVSDEHLVVGCVGTFKPGKGQDLILDLAHALRPRHANVRYVLVGDGPRRQAIERRIEQDRLSDIVVLHGGEDDARRLYGAFDVCLQASESEGLPNVVLEAAAARRAIVATDVGGTNEIITSGLNGILVRRELNDIASAVSRVLADADLRHRLGEAAGARAEDFSVAQLVDATARLYRAVAADVH